MQRLADQPAHHAHRAFARWCLSAAWCCSLRSQLRSPGSSLTLPARGWVGSLGTASRWDRCVRSWLRSNKTITTSVRITLEARESGSLLTQEVHKRDSLGYVVASGVPGIAFSSATCRHRRTLRDRMDTAPTDVRRTDDDSGYGSPEDPSATWAWPAGALAPV